MSDFFLDFRTPIIREQGAALAASAFQFCEDTRVQTFQRNHFSLVLASVNDPRLWDPYQSGSEDGIFVVLAGRVALDESQWRSASEVAGPGGLACKAIYNLYRSQGIAGLSNLNGNFAVLVFDEPARRFYIVTDRSGMMLGYQSDKYPLTFSSHPDVLATTLGQDQDWDSVSLAQFVATGCLTFPQTYYKDIHALSPASIHTLSLDAPSVCYLGKKQYFTFAFNIDLKISEVEMAEELASAFSASVRRRSLPIFGKTAVALSGGLDSRAVLSAIPDRAQVGVFSLYDEPNAELESAEQVAHACALKLERIQRDPEYYGRTADLGVRISGGTGSLGSNHFLGIREKLHQRGFQNLLTGCHCDYMFKGLALNTIEERILRHQKLSAFKFDFYRPHFSIDSKYEQRVHDRLAAIFPDEMSRNPTDLDWLEIEKRRTFPLAYEGDLAQRVIPQRVLPWFPLMADNDLIAVYLRIPPRFKLNASIFRKMLSFICPRDVLNVVDSNTGAAVNAGSLSFAYHRIASAISGRLARKFSPGLQTRGSWLNWEYYIHHSPVINHLWTRNSKASESLLSSIVGPHRFHLDPRKYRGRDIQLFVRLLTIKIWLDQRLRTHSSQTDLDPSFSSTVSR